jgi:hypothetical protein
MKYIQYLQLKSPRTDCISKVHVDLLLLVSRAATGIPANKNVHLGMAVGRGLGNARFSVPGCNGGYMSWFVVVCKQRQNREVALLVTSNDIDGTERSFLTCSDLWTLSTVEFTERYVGVRSSVG